MVGHPRARVRACLVACPSGVRLNRRGHGTRRKTGWKSALELHNDTFYTLDEMSEAPGKSMSEVIYMLGNGSGRARANQDGSARRVKKWCCPVLSTGEVRVERSQDEI